MNGQWEWWTSNSWRRLIHSDRGKSSPILMPTVHKDGQPDIEVSNENMTLIAAAPDMLAALKAYIDQCCEVGESGGWPELKTLRAQMRAAIAKAEGRT